MKKIKSNKFNVKNLIKKMIIIIMILVITLINNNISVEGMEMDEIGVSLLENEIIVASRDYKIGSTWEKTDGHLFSDENSVFKEDQKNYYKITAKNTGGIDIFFRVIVTQYWKDLNRK